jgi:hypothetical protein
MSYMTLPEIPETAGENSKEVSCGDTCVCAHGKPLSSIDKNQTGQFITSNPAARG